MGHQILTVRPIDLQGEEDEAVDEVRITLKRTLFKQLGTCGT